MVIFNSYVSLPEGNQTGSENSTFNSVVNWVGFSGIFWDHLIGRGGSHHVVRTPPDAGRQRCAQGGQLGNVGALGATFAEILSSVVQMFTGYSFRKSPISHFVKIYTIYIYIYIQYIYIYVIYIYIYLFIFPTPCECGFSLEFNYHILPWFSRCFRWNFAVPARKCWTTSAWAVPLNISTLPWASTVVAGGFAAWILGSEKHGRKIPDAEIHNCP